MTVYNLIVEYKNHHPNGHFFDSESLSFFGERISEMRVFEKTRTITDSLGEKHKCYVLSTYQRKAPIKPTRWHHYFDCETFEPILGEESEGETT